VNSSEIILHPQIIPTVLIPLTALSVALSALATFIAALFGIKLRAEGPKKLLEVLLKPKILITAILANLAIIGGIKAFDYYRNLPSFEFRISMTQGRLAEGSNADYPNVHQQSPAPVVNESGPSLKLELTEIANVSMKDGSFRGAVVSGDQFFVGSDEGYVFEYSLPSLELKRKFFVGSKVSPAPIIFNQKLFVGEGTHNTHHARIYRFDLKTGDFDGAIQTKGHTEGQAVVAEDQGKALIFGVAGSDGVIAADPVSLKKVWHQIDGHTDAAVRVHDGLVFSGSGREKNDGKSYRAYATAYDFHSGKKVWQRELPASSWMQPAAYNSQVCFVFGEVYFKSNIGGFACYDSKTGATRTSYMHSQPVVAVPIIVGDDLVISDFMGSVCRVSMLTGKQKWCRATSEMKSSLANAVYDSEHHVLVYPSRKDGLYVLNPRNGDIILNWKPQGEEWNESLAPVAISNWGWILTDMKGKIRLLKPTLNLSAKLDKR